MEEQVHLPILTGTLLELLQLPANARCIDATIDGGGHAKALLDYTAPEGRVLGIDRDSEILTATRLRLDAEVESGRLELVNGSFRELTRIATTRHFSAVQAIIFDLGVSSFHFDSSGRGFSFMRDEPLDMRFDASDSDLESAADILNSRDAEELASIFFKYGEERYSRRIAATVVRRRPLRTTAELLDCIKAALPGRVRWQAARSAARIFQALRIAVNEELEAISEALPQALSLLALGGRLAVLSFHSLEDRFVKHFFLAEQQAGRVKVITKRPLRPDDEEIHANPRAASAKLRVCERVA